MNDRRMTDAYQEDEISLVDIWRVLVKHKKLVFLVWGLISLGGVIAAVLIPEKYAYTTLIEIGHLGYETRLSLWPNLPKGKTELVEVAAEARIRLVAGIIPVTRRKYLSEGKDVPGVEVRIPEKSPSLLLLESRGPARSAPGQLAFHGDVVDALRQEHQPVLNKAREAFDAQQEAVKRETAKLQDRSVRLAAKSKRLDVKEAYLKRRTEQFRATNAAVARLGEKAIGQKVDEDATRAYMMMTNQIRQQRSLDMLEEWLVLGLPNERAEIDEAISDNGRAVDGQLSALNIITSGLGGMRETRAVIPPTQSVSPVAPNRRLIIALAILGGLMLAVLGAFLMEFFIKVRKEADTLPG